jgi:hypothetical protein
VTFLSISKYFQNFLQLSVLKRKRCISALKIAVRMTSPQRFTRGIGLELETTKLAVWCPSKAGDDALDHEQTGRTIATVTPVTETD